MSQEVGVGPAGAAGPSGARQQASASQRGAYYGSSYPYGYGYNAYDDCPTVQQRVWDGWGYRIAWVNSCDYY